MGCALSPAPLWFNERVPWAQSSYTAARGEFSPEACRARERHWVEDPRPKAIRTLLYAVPSKLLAALSLCPSRGRRERRAPHGAARDSASRGDVAEWNSQPQTPLRAHPVAPETRGASRADFEGARGPLPRRAVPRRRLG
jgi:hypothetical protein